MGKQANLLQSVKDLILREPDYRNPLPGEIVPCCLCRKPYLMRPYSGPPDPICPECFTTYADCAKIICKNCKVIVARVSPEVLESGYYVRPRSVLHTLGCPKCSKRLRNMKEEQVEATPIQEIDEWERRMGRKTIVAVRYAGKKKKAPDTI